MATVLKRARGVHCSPEQRDAIRERAAAAGSTVSRLVLDAALADRTGGRASALSAEELAELHRGFRTLVAFVGFLRDRTAEGGDPGGAVSGSGDGAARSARPPAGAVRLSISATDREWTAIGRQARRRGLPVSRYLVGLVLPDSSVSGSPAGPLPALDGAEQRELLGAARLMRALFTQTGGADAALEGMRERFAALLHAGEPGGNTSGRGEGDGENRSGTAAPPQTPPGPTGAEGPQRADSPGARTEPEAKPSGQDTLL